MYWVLLASLGVIAAMTIVLSNAEAIQFSASYNKFITITRSDTCEMVQCIKIKDLIKYDTSNKKISGDFVYQPDKGDYVRAKGMPNHVNWYFGHYANRTLVFVEPDSSITVRSKQIIIRGNLQEFAPPSNLTKVDYGFGKQKTITYKGVYVDPKCNVATIGINQYPNITKVIQHLISDCTTPLDNKVVNITNKTKLLYCGIECQHRHFMETAKELSKNKLIKAGKS